MSSVALGNHVYICKYKVIKSHVLYNDVVSCSAFPSEQRWSRSHPISDFLHHYQTDSTLESLREKRSASRRDAQRLPHILVRIHSRVSHSRAARIRPLFPPVAGHKSASGKLSHSIIVGTLTTQPPPSRPSLALYSTLRRTTATSASLQVIPKTHGESSRDAASL